MAQTETQFLLLLLVGALVGAPALRWRLPYTVALVVAGIGLGTLHLSQFASLHLTPELLMMVFLPALLFEAAFHLKLDDLRRESFVVLWLAVPGVAVAVTVTALLSWVGVSAIFDPAFSLGNAFLFASMIAATDPISVLALFRTLGVTRRLYLLVEGESLLNDGVAVVVFLIVAAVLGVHVGHAEAPHLEGLGEVVVYAVRTFAWMAAGGVLVGAAVGAAASVLTRQVDDKLIETAMTVVVAYGSFLVAEQVRASGVLATVTAGLVLGSFGSQFGMSVRTRVAVADFWEFFAFFSNTFVFLLVGLELDIVALLSAGGAIALAFVAVLLGRAATVYGSLPIIRRLAREPVPVAWGHVMVWGGLRGSLSMVLVIGLPADFPGRSLLVLLVFGVVSISLVLQALTMKPLLARLGLVKGAVARVAYETARARTLMAQAALAALDKQRDHLEPNVREALLERYAAQLQDGRAAARSAVGERFDEERMQDATLHLLAVEADALRHAQSEGIVGEEAAESLHTALGEERERLVHDEGE